AKLWQTVCTRPVDQVDGPAGQCRLMHLALCYDPVPEVRRLIFIATPHRGSPLASGQLRELGTRLCLRSSPFHQARPILLASNTPDTFTPEFRTEFPTSAGELSPEHPLMMCLNELATDSSVRSHSIIADLRDPPRPGTTDGMVPYWSSHLEGVASELLVH